jgi:hypothetical protein
MPAKRRLGALAMLLGLLLPAAAHADTATVDAYFFTRGEGSEHAEKITSASMDERALCILVHGTELPDGEHEYHLTVQDGRNHDAWRTSSTLRPLRGVWRDIACYAYNREVDAPGTWTFSSEMDGKTVLEREIEVSAPQGRR